MTVRTRAAVINEVSLGVGVARAKTEADEEYVPQLEHLQSSEFTMVRFQVSWQHSMWFHFSPWSGQHHLRKCNLDFKGSMNMTLLQLVVWIQRAHKVL